MFKRVARRWAARWLIIPMRRLNDCRPGCFMVRQ